MIGDRESGMIDVGDWRVDLTELGGDAVNSMVWLGGVRYEGRWWPWIKGGGVCSSGGVSRYDGTGAGAAHRVLSGVVGVLGGVVGGVSRSEGKCAGAAQSSEGARGL